MAESTRRECVNSSGMVLDFYQRTTVSNKNVDIVNHYEIWNENILKTDLRSLTLFDFSSLLKYESFLFVCNFLFVCMFLG